MLSKIAEKLVVAALASTPPIWLSDHLVCARWPWRDSGLWFHSIPLGFATTGRCAKLVQSRSQRRRRYGAWAIGDHPLTSKQMFARSQSPFGKRL